MKNQTRLSVLLLALFILAGLVGCGQQPGPLDVDALLGSAAGGEELRAAATVVAEVRPTSVPQGSPTPEFDQHCVDCHTDVEILKALATEKEHETESEGEG